MTKLDNLRIAFLPYKDTTNTYIAKMQCLLSNFGKIEEVVSIKAIFLAILVGNFKRYDVLWVNFAENDLLNRSGYLSLFNLLKVFSKTMVLICLSKKTFFVRHNNYPHATHPNRIELLTKLLNIYERMFDTVITHSGAEANGNKIYCPHPLYTLVADDESRDDFLKKLPEEYFVVFGRILPYKKIEILVKSFPPYKTLLVAGAVGDKNYAQKLNDISQANFVFMPGYLTEIEAQKLLAASKAVFIAHSDADMVVSGSFFYAMSLGKPVFAVQTKFLNWIKPRIPSDLLILANDIDALCRLIDDYVPEKDAKKHTVAIQSEFGDKTMNDTLSKILNCS